MRCGNGVCERDAVVRMSSDGNSVVLCMTCLLQTLIGVGVGLGSAAVEAALSAPLPSLVMPSAEKALEELVIETADEFADAVEVL